MQKALDQAQEAFENNEVPIGAVVVNKEGAVIGVGYNQVEKNKCQTFHAEVLAVKQACAFIKDWRLDDCWLYVTLEPCTMCMGLLKLSRITGVVYGPDSPLFGYQLDNAINNQVYNKNAITIIKGVCSEKSVELLKQFFKNKRKKSE